VPYGTDGMVFGKHLEAVVLGPGDIRQAHTHDEWVSIGQLKKGIEVYAKLIGRFCAQGVA
jgi:acetylornithine deacetylase